MRKSFSIMGIVAIVLCAAGMLAGRIGAQETRDPAPSTVRGALNDTSLLQMLTDLGYEPKKLKQGYVVAIKQGEWTFNVQFLISQNREKIGMNANMGTVEDTTAITATQWMNLLATNTDIAPSFFYFNKNNHTLYMHRVLDNRGLTPPFMRQQIENFCSNIKETGDLWKFTK